MNRPNPLDTLIDQSRKARDSAGRALAEEQQSRAQTAAQLEALQQYRGEYRERLQEAMRRGVGTDTLNDYSRFIQSLDGAITRASDVLAQQGERLEAGRQHWQKHQQQLASYDTLAQRRAHSEHQRQALLERRHTDEITQSLIARRPPAEDRNP